MIDEARCRWPSGFFVGYTIPPSCWLSPIRAISFIASIVGCLSICGCNSSDWKAKQTPYPYADQWLSRYGEPRPISDRDVRRLPGRLTLHELYKRWGFIPVGESHGIEYHSHFYDFRYIVGLDFDSPDEPVDNIEVTAIYLGGGGPDETWETVWFSEDYVPKQSVSQSQIDDIPDVVSFDYIRTHLPTGKVTHFNEIVSITACRAPLAGYCFELYFVRPKNSNKQPELASIYLQGAGRRLLKWGKLIDPGTGELYTRASADPFAPEEIPRRFLR